MFLKHINLVDMFFTLPEIYDNRLTTLFRSGEWHKNPKPCTINVTVHDPDYSTSLILNIECKY